MFKYKNEFDERSNTQVIVEGTLDSWEILQ